MARVLRDQELTEGFFGHWEGSVMAKQAKVELEPDLAQYIDRDFPQVGPITKEVIESNLKRGYNLRGSIRLMLGRLWTDDAYERYKRRVLSKPLP